MDFEVQKFPLWLYQCPENAAGAVFLSLENIATTRLCGNDDLVSCFNF